MSFPAGPDAVPSSSPLSSAPPTSSSQKPILKEPLLSLKLPTSEVPEKDGRTHLESPRRDWENAIAAPSSTSTLASVKPQTKVTRVYSRAGRTALPAAAQTATPSSLGTRSSPDAASARHIHRDSMTASSSSEASSPTRRHPDASTRYTTAESSFDRLSSTAKVASSRSSLLATKDKAGTAATRRRPPPASHSASSDDDDSLDSVEYEDPRKKLRAVIPDDSDNDDEPTAEETKRIMEALRRGDGLPARQTSHPAATVASDVDKTPTNKTAAVTATTTPIAAPRGAKAVLNHASAMAMDAGMAAEAVSSSLTTLPTSSPSDTGRELATSTDPPEADEEEDTFPVSTGRRVGRIASTFSLARADGYDDDDEDEDEPLPTYSRAAGKGKGHARRAVVDSDDDESVGRRPANNSNSMDEEESAGAAGFSPSKRVSKFPPSATFTRGSAAYNGRDFLSPANTRTRSRSPAPALELSLDMASDNMAEGSSSPVKSSVAGGGQGRLVDKRTSSVEIEDYRASELSSSSPARRKHAARKSVIPSDGSVQPETMAGTAGGENPVKKVKAMSKKDKELMDREIARRKREVEGGLSRPEPKQHDMKAFLAGFRNKPKTEKPLSMFPPPFDLKRERISSHRPSPAPSAAPQFASASRVPAPSAPPPSAKPSFSKKQDTMSEDSPSGVEALLDLSELSRIQRDNILIKKRQAAAAQMKQEALAHMQAAAASKASAAVQDNGDDSDDLEIVVNSGPNDKGAFRKRLPDQTIELLRLAQPTSTPSEPRRLKSKATESQLINAGKTFGHALKRELPTPGKKGVKYQQAIGQEALNETLSKAVAAHSLKLRREKEAKYGPGRKVDEKVELDVDAALAKLEAAGLSAAGADDEMGEGADDSDDPEDGHFRSEGEAASGGEEMDEHAEEDADETQQDDVGMELADEENNAAVGRGDRERSDASSAVGSDKENSRPRDMIDADDDKENARPRSRSIGQRDQSPQPLSAREFPGLDEDEDEEFRLMRPKTKRPRTALHLADDDDDDGGGDNINDTPPRRAESAPLQPLARASSAAQLAQLSMGGEIASTSQRPASPHLLGAASHLGAAFGEDSLGESDFGEGGFSQLFEPTQVPTQLATASESETHPGGSEDNGEGEGGFDLGEDGGFSQLFEATQAAPAPAKKSAGGLLARKRDLPVDGPQSTLQPEPEVSESQLAFVDQVWEINNPDGVAPPPTQKDRQYLNEQGFFTQTKPAAYVYASSSGITPRTDSAAPWMASTDTPASPTARFANSTDSPIKPYQYPDSSPVQPTNRRLVARRPDDSPPGSPTEETTSTVSTVWQTPVATATSTLGGAAITSASAGPSSSPLVKLLPRPPKAPNERREKKGLQKSAFVEAEAEESDDEEAGFGGFGGVGRGREDEEEEDQDQPVEGLVDDEEMSEEKKAEAEITRLELVRQQEEAADVLAAQRAQDVVDGKLRMKKKDGTGLDFDSDEEEERFGKSSRKEERRLKRKLEGLDPLDRIAADPETQAFAEAYKATHAVEIEGYEDLRSDGEDDQPETQGSASGETQMDDDDDQSSSLLAKVGIGRSRSHHRIVASPDPISRTGSFAALADTPIYEDLSDNDDTNSSQIAVRRGSTRQRPQPQPVQHDDDAFSLHDTFRRGSSSSNNSAKRARLAEHHKHESQNSAGGAGASRGGSGSSVVALKRKPSGANTESGSDVRLKPLKASGSLHSLLGGGSVESSKGKWTK